MASDRRPTELSMSRRLRSARNSPCVAPKRREQIEYRALVVGDNRSMADREQRTPFYWIVLILAALGASLAVSYYGPTWFRVTVYILTVLLVLVGGVMTFRDYPY